MQLVGDQSPSQRGAAAIVIILLAALAVGTAEHPAGSADRELTVAVMRDGFGVLEGTPGDRRIIHVDRDGGEPRTIALAADPAELRFVGTRGGPLVGYRKGDKLELARVAKTGELRPDSTWGRRVAGLCDGVGTNARQWAISWIEKDEQLWYVWGPTSPKQPAAEEGPAAVEVAVAARTTWCGVTSAGAGFVLAWRDHRNRMFFDRCDKKCRGTMRMPVSDKHRFEGIACNDTSCVVAMRDDGGRAHLGWMTIAGKVVWSKPLTDATAESRFSLTAAGKSAFVVAYVGREGASAVRVIESGSMVRAWADPYSRATPAVTWASDRLLVAHRHEGGQVAPEVVPLPD